MKYIFTLFALTNLFCANNIIAQNPNQIKSKTISKADLPTKLQYKGKFKQALTWKDALGENFVVLTETGEHNKKIYEDGLESFDADVYAYHYIKTQTGIHENWQFNERISDCAMHMDAKFLTGTFQITDLNADNIAEIWFMTLTGCRGDVTPTDLSLNMYENKTKYSIKGSTRVEVYTDEDGNAVYDGGKGVMNSNLNKASEAFKGFAKKMWQANNSEKI